MRNPDLPIVVEPVEAKNCRLPAAFRREGTIQPDEVASSEMRFIRQAQEEVFKEEIRAVKTKKQLPNGSRLQPLGPVLSEDGVLRCDGRLRYAEYLPWETRYPIILPRSHWVTTLIIKQAHEQSEHGGTNQVLAQLGSNELKELETCHSNSWGAVAL